MFGTVVDWRGTILREGKRLSARKGWTVDWAAFADAWRAGYGPSMQKVRSGALPWTTIDVLHRMILDDLIPRFGLGGLTPEERDDLNRVWHRLDPWPDAVGGLSRLRARFVIAPLSNGNVSLLTHMARHAGLPWDCILSAELAQHYKPDREAYETAARLLDEPPERVMMVAAHKGDLRAAHGVGFRTALVPRPLEHGPGGKVDEGPEPFIDVVAKDFHDLASRLGP